MIIQGFSLSMDLIWEVIGILSSWINLYIS